MPSLLLWTCGPVQDFIASARKGRDLWFGSWMLSEIATAAAAHAMHAGAQLVMPDPPSVAALMSSDFDVPNRVLAEIAGDDPQPVAEGMSEAARARLLQLARDTFDVLERNHAELFDREEATEQMEDVLDTAWAAVTATGREAADRQRVEALLAARKATRVFGPASFAAWSVAKSSLDAQREAVTAPGAGLRLGLTHDERLCGVGLLKRQGLGALEEAGTTLPGGSIPSVSTQALLSWLSPATATDRAGVAEALHTFCRTLEESGVFAKGALRQRRAHPLLGHLEPHALYASRLIELTAAPKDLPACREVQMAAMAALRARLGLRGEPTPYYAVILADGDRLGEHLDARSHEQVRQMSRALSAFSRNVRERVFDQDRLEGVCVYAGGDDVLAFAPVHVALDKSAELAEAFGGAFTDLSFLDSTPTLSAGIAIAHHLTPLRDALGGAKAAERHAKDDEGRDAWSILLSKRSGSPVTVGGHWDERADMQRVVALTHPDGPLPRGLPYELRSVAQRLQQPDSEPERFELMRVLRQKGLVEHAPWLLAQSRGGLERLADRLSMGRALSGMGTSA